MTEENDLNNQQNIDPDELTELKNKCEEYLNGWKRAQADYQNLKREIEEKKKDWADFIQANMLMEILPIIDTYKIALTHVPDDVKKEAWYEGFGHIYKNFTEFIKKLGITEIKTQGEIFNPEFHEAVSQTSDETKEDHEIIKELTPGYKMNEKVLAPAKVIVNVKND